MKRQGKHISKFLRDPLPNPEIPADDAWAGMTDMLDNGPTSAPDQGANGQGQLWSVWKAATRFKGLLIAASVVVTSAVVALIVLNAETQNNKSTENQTIDSKISNPATVRPAVKTSAPEFKKESILTPGSSSETTYSETTTAGIPTTETTVSEMTPAGIPTSKTGSGKIKSAKTPETGISRPAATKLPPTRKAVTSGITGSNGSTISANERIKTGTRRSDNLVTDPRRTRMGTSPADVTRIRDAYTQAGSRAQVDAPSPINSLNAGQAAHKPATTAETSLNSLKPLAGHFQSRNHDLSKAVQKPALPNAPQPSAKSHNSLWRDIHFGPEWNVNRAVGTTEYMFAGADSVKHPWRLAIPGLFVSKSWNRHSATFIFNPLHTYFGEKERVAQRIDTMRVTDSIFNIISHNTNFIKAFGTNFSLQYQYQASPWISLVAGLSYARYSAALLRKEMEFMGNTFPEAHLAARGRETLKSYIRPQQWSIRVGVLSGSPQVLNGRLQFGLNVIIPVSSLSLNGFKSVKSPNIQGSIRFLIK